MVKLENHKLATIIVIDAAEGQQRMLKWVNEILMSYIGYLPSFRFTPRTYLIINKRKVAILPWETWKTLPNQVIKVNITSDWKNQHHVSFDMKRIHHFCVVLPKVLNLNISLRKITAKHQLRDCLKYTWPLVLK